MPQSLPPDSDDRRIKAGTIASELLGLVDDELLALHDQACAAMYRYAMLLVERQLSPALVLGQMDQVAVVVFCERLLPHMVAAEEGS